MSTVDRSNMYDLEEYWLKEIAPKYFDMKDISLNRVGLFGYINEIMSHSVESIANENSILYNEIFFKRAVLPQSIYAYASHYGIEDIMAKPATMGFALGIREDTLLKKSISKGDETYFIIDSDSTIMVENEIPFMLDYDIKINIREVMTTKNYLFSAKYVTRDDDDNELNNPVSSINSTSNPFLKVAHFKTDNTKYVVVYVTAHQCEKNVVDKTIYSKEFIDYFSFDIENDIEDDLQLLNFNAYYKAPGNNNYIQLEKYLPDAAGSLNPFCFYQFKDNNKINISFSTISRYFRPEFNSELKFKIYNTRGAYGNFEYTGDNVQMLLSSAKYDYSDVIMFAQATSNSTGGINSKTYEEIKEDVAVLASTCQSIGTEIDLNAYFESIENSSNMMFVKKRDDILDRTFGAFLLMKDGKGNIVPSNSVDIVLSKQELLDNNCIYEEATQRGVIKCGQSFRYKANERILHLSNLSDNDSNTQFRYTNPFTIVINENPLFTEYYQPSISASFVPAYTEVDDRVPTNFIINKINFDRDALRSNYYDIQFDLIPSVDELDIDYATVDKDTGIVTDNNIIKVIGVIYDDDGDLNFTFDCKMIGAKNNKYTYQSKIYTDDYMTLYGNLRTINNSLFNLKDFEDKNPLINASNLKIGFVVMLKTKDVLGEVFSSDYQNLLNQDLSEYSLSNVFKIDEDVSLVTNLTNVMRSTIEYEYDDNGNINYHINEVPVIRYDYLYNATYSKQFIRTFASDYNNISEVLYKVTNAFDISMKFYNSYGRSYYFYIDNDTNNTLNKVNLEMNLRIKISENKIMDEVLKQEIRDFIINYIDEVNDDINFYVSNLIKNLENNFNAIEYINFKNFNGYSSSIQSIEKNFPVLNIDETYKYKDFVPEYLNINKEYDGYDTVTHSVNVEFV